MISNLDLAAAGVTRGYKRLSVFGAHGIIGDVVAMALFIAG